jgi:hypothetical protein
MCAREAGLCNLGKSALVQCVCACARARQWGPIISLTLSLIPPLLRAAARKVRWKLVEQLWTLAVVTLWQYETLRACNDQASRYSKDDREWGKKENMRGMKKWKNPVERMER